MCQGVCWNHHCPGCGTVVYKDTFIADTLRRAGHICKTAVRNRHLGCCRTGIQWWFQAKWASELCLMCELREDMDGMSAETCDEAALEKRVLPGSDDDDDDADEYEGVDVNANVYYANRDEVRRGNADVVEESTDEKKEEEEITDKDIKDEKGGSLRENEADDENQDIEKNQEVEEVEDEHEYEHEDAGDNRGQDENHDEDGDASFKSDEEESGNGDDGAQVSPPDQPIKDDFLPPPRGVVGRSRKRTSCLTS
ncbi:hypothetical protein GGR52DRAFT_539645 [Hypoxylon sp. FL1284]|nr:hypothetical protein GGR52DRAFT_539645 [Hypoxylon sp. FL1284]